LYLSAQPPRSFVAGIHFLLPSTVQTEPNRIKPERHIQASDALYGQWKGKNNVKACPRCQRHIEKNGGCNHMKCIKCHADWCWTCSKLYTGSNPCVCPHNYYYHAPGYYA
jgi:hypothetical protein